MTKEEIVANMTLYTSVFENSGLQLSDIEAFAQWFLSQDFRFINILTPNIYHNSKNKQLFELAASTGVILKGYTVICPTCGDKTGGFMEADRKAMPNKSRCNKGHCFDTFNPRAIKETYYVKGITAHTYY